MEVSFEPLQMDNIVRMTEDFVPEDASIYESCSICYESFTNKSFINECLHPFCYKCITDWTKVKAVCPLCIRPITRILHNIRSQDDYDVHEVVPPERDVLSLENDFFYEDEDSDGYTNTDSDYGAMESMDDNYDFDNMYDEYGDHGFNNFEGYESNNDEYQDDNASEHPDDNASEHLATEMIESDDDFKDGPEEDETSVSTDPSENGDESHEYHNAISDCEVDNEDSYDCDSNDEDADSEDSEINYFDNFFEDAEDQDCEEQENELETIDVSDDSYEEEYEEEEEEFEDSSASDEEYYLSDRY